MGGHRQPTEYGYAKSARQKAVFGTTVFAIIWVFFCYITFFTGKAHSGAILVMDWIAIFGLGFGVVMSIVKTTLMLHRPYVAIHTEWIRVGNGRQVPFADIAMAGRLENPPRYEMVSNNGGKLTVYLNNLDEGQRDDFLERLHSALADKLGAHRQAEQAPTGEKPQ